MGLLFLLQEGILILITGRIRCCIFGKSRLTLIWNICNFNFLWDVFNIISISLWDFGFFFFLNLLIFNLRFNNWCIACSELSIIYCILESKHVFSLIPSWEEAVNTRVRVYLARTRRNSPPHHQSLCLCSCQRSSCLFSAAIINYQSD